MPTNCTLSARIANGTDAADITTIIWFLRSAPTQREWDGIGQIAPLEDAVQEAIHAGWISPVGRGLRVTPDGLMRVDVNTAQRLGLIDHETAVAFLAVRNREGERLYSGRA